MALAVQLVHSKMNQLVALILILFSHLAFAASSGSFDDEDDAPVAAPVAKPAPSKPAPVTNDDDDDDDDEEEEAPARRPVRKDDGLLSPSRAAARQGAFNDDEEESEGVYKGCRNCSRPSPPPARLPIRTHITAPSDVLRSRVWSSFQRNFEECAPGCQPVDMGSYRDPHVRPKPSCHHISAAIDVGGMKCGGQLYMARRETARPNNGRGRFSDVVRCIERKGMRTMYMVADHFDHAHFSYGCVLPGGIRMTK